MMSKVTLPPPRDCPQAYIDLGMQHPYDDLTPVTIEDVTANAVLAALSNRKVFNDVLNSVPPNYRSEIIEDLAVVIRSCLANSSGELEFNEPLPPFVEGD
jgi:hypothetical protein